jgi:pimeloyl-ACP methyl ester carboxylesterase
MTLSRAISRSSESAQYKVRKLKFHVRHWPGDSSAPLKVILHGWMDVSATWQRLVDYLPVDWNIAAPDQRGFGLSEAAGDTYWFYDYLGDLDGLLEQLSPDKPVDLIGHSMGSQVAALYAGVRPERVRRLVALDGFYLPVSAPERAPLQLRNWLQELQKTPTDKRYPDLDTLAKRIALRQPGLDEEGARFIAACWSQRDEQGQYRLLGDAHHRQRGPLLYRDEEALAIFSQITAPTLILDAEKSYLAMASKQDLRRARLDCFANRAEQTVPGGHMLHFDAPEETADKIAAFLSAH